MGATFPAEQPSVGKRPLVIGTVCEKRPQNCALGKKISRKKISFCYERLDVWVQNLSSGWSFSIFNKFVDGQNWKETVWFYQFYFLGFFSVLLVGFDLKKVNVGKKHFDFISLYLFKFKKVNIGRKHFIYVGFFLNQYQREALYWILLHILFYYINF